MLGEAAARHNAHREEAMEKMEIRVKKTDPMATLPVYASGEAAGADLHACLKEKIVIGPGETVMVSTGIAMEIPKGYAGFVYGRSGTAVKRGLAPANKVGVIDSDYRGEIMVGIYNHGAAPAEILPNERIAQIVIAPVAQCTFVSSEELEDTRRGAGGFGSTGKL